MQILIDGQCPLCAREAAFLSRLDRGRGRLAMVDITAPGFDPARFGVTMEQAMGRIHAVAPDGSLLTGLEVFRRAYALVSPGLGALWSVTGWPLLRVGFDALYRWFARNRHRLTGRRGACAGDRCVPR
jgi:predicted DCC family thiol-disulfide oxidoreductase YuxK